MTGQANSSILAGAWHKLDGVHSDISILQVVVDHIVCIWIARSPGDEYTKNGISCIA